MRQSQRWVRWLGAFFSFAILIWAATALNWQQISIALVQTNYTWIAIAILLVFVTFVSRAYRWQSFFFPKVFSVGVLFSTLLIGQTINYIAPARAGDLGRALLFNQLTGISKVQSLSTIALEKLWDILFLLLFTLGLAWVFPLPNWLLTPAKSLLILMSMALAGVGILLWRSEVVSSKLGAFLGKWVPEKWQSVFERLFDSVVTGLAGMRYPDVWRAALGWSLVTWGAGVAINYAIFRAFDLSLGIIPAVLLLIVLQVGVAVPSLPGRIGVFEGLCVAVLALFDVPYDVAFSYALILHGVVFVPPIAAAILLSSRLKLNIKDFSKNEG